jgi:hypothetical protein
MKNLISYENFGQDLSAGMNEAMTTEPPKGGPQSAPAVSITKPSTVKTPSFLGGADNRQQQLDWFVKSLAKVDSLAAGETYLGLIKAWKQPDYDFVKGQISAIYNAAGIIPRLKALGFGPRSLVSDILLKSAFFGTLGAGHDNAIDERRKMFYDIQGALYRFKNPKEKW